MSFLVWPSKMDSFLQFIQKTYFKASVNVNMHVKIEQASNEEFPTKQCIKCEEKFQNSNLLPSIDRVNWNLVATSTYDLEETVGFPLSYAYINNLFFSVKDERLHELVTSLTGWIFQWPIKANVQQYGIPGSPEQFISKT